VFRAIHSIKGGGGAFGFTSLVGFAHAYETLLDHVRDGRIELSDPVTMPVSAPTTSWPIFVAAAKADEELAPTSADEKAQPDALTRGDHADGEGGELMEEFDIDFVPVMVGSAVPPRTTKPLQSSSHLLPRSRQLRRVAADGRARPLGNPVHAARRALCPRQRPAAAFRELASLGEIEVKVIFNEIPPLADFEPSRRLLFREITLNAPNAAEADIAEVFEFVEGNCDLSIAQLRQRPRLRPPPQWPNRRCRRQWTRRPKSWRTRLSFAELAETLAPTPPAAVKALRPAAASRAAPAKPMAITIAGRARTSGATACSRSASISTRSIASSTWWASW
jgi:two-component system chemotaxis sensor kinase CheA